jgi:DNA-binding transcriptional MocR family regulator
VLSDRSVAVPGLEYGPDWGDQRLRQSLAKWLTTFYNYSAPIDVERITITGGASQNLACILQTFTDPGYTRNIWMVTPTYFLAFRIFNDSGFDEKLRAVPEDEEGIDVEYLRAAIEKSEQEAKSNGNDKPVSIVNIKSLMHKNCIEIATWVPSHNTSILMPRKPRKIMATPKKSLTES